MIYTFFLTLQVYDWITILYVIVGIASFIWASIGNNYVIKRINKLSKKTSELKMAKRKSGIYFTELRDSWLRNQNIWVSVDFFLVGLSYLSMVIVIYMGVDNIITDAMILNQKITFYTIINLLSTAFRDYLMPRKKSLGARKAYILLNEVILKYEDCRATQDDLIKAVNEGEKIMTQSTYED